MSNEREKMIAVGFAQIHRMWELPEYWDGRRAHHITDVACEVARAVINSVAVDTGASPQVFPLSDGGLQVEWLYAGNHVEVEIEPDGSIYVTAISPSGVWVVDVAADGVNNGSLALDHAHEFLAEAVSSNPPI